MTISQKKGKTLYYAKVSNQDRTTISQIEELIEKSTSLAPSDIKLVLSAFARFVFDSLRYGNTVELGKLGTLKVVVSSRMEENPE